MNESTWVRCSEQIVLTRVTIKETATERYESWTQIDGSTVLVMVTDEGFFVMRHSRASFDRISAPTWIEPESAESIAGNARAIESFSRIPMPSDAVRQIETRIDNERDRAEGYRF